MLLFVAFLLLASSLRVAQEYQRAIVFRLGRDTGTRGPGLYWLVPLIERQQAIDMRTKTLEQQQEPPGASPKRRGEPTASKS